MASDRVVHENRSAGATLQFDELVEKATRRPLSSEESQQFIILRRYLIGNGVIKGDVGRPTTIEGL